MSSGRGNLWNRCVSTSVAPLDFPSCATVSCSDPNLNSDKHIWPENATEPRHPSDSFLPSVAPATHSVTGTNHNVLKQNLHTVVVGKTRVDITFLSHAEKLLSDTHWAPDNMVTFSRGAGWTRQTQKRIKQKEHKYLRMHERSRTRRRHWRWCQLGKTNFFLVIRTDAGVDVL